MAQPPTAAETQLENIRRDGGFKLSCGCFKTLVARHVEAMVLAHGVEAAVANILEYAGYGHTCPPKEIGP